MPSPALRSLLGIGEFSETAVVVVLTDQFGDLRTMTSGRGQFSMEFSHYAPCPRNVAEEVIAKAKEKEEALRAGK